MSPSFFILVPHIRTVFAEKAFFKGLSCGLTLLPGHRDLLCYVPFFSLGEIVSNIAYSFHK